MINFSNVIPQYRGLVGFRSEKGISLDPIYMQSDSGLYVNEKPIDLEGIQKAIALKPDLSPYMSVNEYIASIYDDTIRMALKDFINFSIIRTKIEEKRKYIVGTSEKGYSYSNSTNFIGFLIFPKKNEVATLKQLKINCTKSQTIRLFIYDFETSQEIENIDYILSAGMNTISIERTFSIPVYIGLFKKDPSAPQSWQLDEDNTLYYFSFDDYERFFPIVANITTSENTELQNIEKTPFIIFVNLEKDYSAFLIENREVFSEIIQKNFQLKILNDIVHTFEFNTITESNRKIYTQAILQLTNELQGYSFQQQDRIGYQIGIYEKTLERCRTIEPSLFPTLEKIQI